jgi:hypothetical protein
LICGPVHIASVSLVPGFSFRKEGEIVFGHVEVVNDDKCSPTTRNAGSSSILWFLDTSHSTSELSAACQLPSCHTSTQGMCCAMPYFTTSPVHPHRQSLWKMSSQSFRQTTTPSFWARTECTLPSDSTTIIVSMILQSSR